MNKIQHCEPGTLNYTGLHTDSKIQISLIDYNNKILSESEITLDRLDELRDYKERDTITWVNVDGLHDVEIIRKIGEIFDIHPLVLEDVLHIDQRPKADVYDNYIFVIIKMLNYNELIDVYESEQLSLVFGRNFVISFQEEAGDEFDPVRERIRQSTRIRQMGADYLAYSILDVIIDSYFHVMERMGGWIETLEDEIVKRPNTRRTLEINDLKRDLNFLRRNIWPVRDVMATLMRREESGFITKETSIFLRDAHDHIVLVIENIETYRDMISNLMDLYLSNLSYKMNEVMKILTMIATIFIPITFITSLYGMNFKYMPELTTRYGYFAVWGIILLISGGMIMFFKRKKWL